MPSLPAGVDAEVSLFSFTTLIFEIAVGIDDMRLFLSSLGEFLAAALSL
jgi:hypothetical protein